MASKKYRQGSHCPAWLCFGDVIRATCDNIELELGKRYGASPNVKALRILQDIKRLAKDLDDAIDQLEEERK